MKLALQASEIILCVAKHSEALQHLQNVSNWHHFCWNLVINAV